MPTFSTACNGTGTAYTTTCTTIIFNSWMSTGTTSSVTTDLIWPVFVSGTGTQTAAFTAPHVMRQAVPADYERITRKPNNRPTRKAKALLLRVLRADQRAEYRDKGWFHVVGGHTGKKYRIRRGRVANVDVYEGEKIVRRLCAHPAIYCPDEDTMVAQKLHLESAHDELDFVSRANVHPVPSFAVTERETAH